MLIDSLDVGGAETHVETLALELVKMGCEVSIASNGGKIAQKLESEGVKQLFLPSVTPFANASVSSNASQMEQSGDSFAPKTNLYYEKMKKIMEDLPLPLRLMVAGDLLTRYVDTFKPDLVHAHTRRMAFIVTPICRRRKIPLVFTAHAMFSMDCLKMMMSRWGDAVIAVSDDIKECLESWSGACEREKTRSRLKKTPCQTRLIAFKNTPTRSGAFKKTKTRSSTTARPPQRSDNCTHYNIVPHCFRKFCVARNLPPITVIPNGVNIKR